VRLVDDEQRDAHAREPVAEPRFAEPLGRDVRDARAILREPRQRGRFVAARASRTAVSTASVPETTKRTIW